MRKAKMEVWKAKAIEAHLHLEEIAESIKRPDDKAAFFEHVADLSQESAECIMEEELGLEE